MTSIFDHGGVLYDAQLPTEDDKLDDLFNKLDVIEEKSVKKRLTVELSKMIEDKFCGTNDINIDLFDYNCPKNNTYVKKYKVSIFIDSKKRLYTFTVPASYPFRPPKLDINYKPYFEYLKIENTAFYLALNEYKKKRCFCCSSVLCDDNWSIFMTLKTIINEVDEFSDICKEIAYIAMVNVVKRKYLIDDINIMEWLY